MGALNAVSYTHLVALNMMDAARKRGIAIDVAALQHELGMPVVETVAVQRHGARGLVDTLDAPMPEVPPAHAPLDDAALHAEVRRLLALAVAMPRRTAAIDDALDRWLLHPVFGMLALGVVMFLIFQAVYAWATPLMDGIEAATTWLGTHTLSLIHI